MEMTLKILKWVGFSIFILILLVFGYMLFCRLVLREHVPTLFGYSIQRVGSDSMAPTLYTNDMVINKKQDKYEVGDIVTYVYKGQVRTHRVKFITDIGYMTRGDNRDSNDPEITQDMIVGKVINHIPKIGAVLKIFQSLVFDIGVLVVCVLLLVLPPILKRKKEEE